MELWKIICSITYGIMLCILIVEIRRICRSISAHLPQAEEDIAEDLKAVENLKEKTMKQQKLLTNGAEYLMRVDPRVIRLVRFLADYFCMCHQKKTVITFLQNEYMTITALQEIIDQSLEFIPKKLKYRILPRRNKDMLCWDVKIWVVTEEVSEDETVL